MPLRATQYSATFTVGKPIPSERNPEPDPDTISVYVVDRFEFQGPNAPWEASIQMAAAFGHSPKQAKDELVRKLRSLADQLEDSRFLGLQDQ